MAKQEATLILRIKELGSEAIDKISGALGFLAKGAAVAFTAISAFAGASLKAYKEQEEATNKLNQALVNQGIYSKQTAANYATYAAELQKTTTFADENIIAAQASVQAHLGQIPVTRELTKAILDYAQATGKDAVSAAEAIGKSIGTSTNALARNGIEVDANSSKQEKMAQVLAGIERKWGGQAVAAGKGLGVLERMKNAMGEILETAGERFAPVIEHIANAVIKFSEDIQGSSAALDGFSATLKLAIETGIIFKNIIVGVGEYIGASFGTIFGAAAQAMSGNFAQAYETIKSGATDVSGMVVNRWQQTKDELNGIDEAFLAKTAQKNAAEEEMLRQSNSNKAAISAEAQVLKDEDFTVKSEEEINKMTVHEQMKIDAMKISDDQKIALGEALTLRMAAENQKRIAMEKAYADQKYKSMTDMQKMESFINSQKVSNLDSTFSRMSQMQNSQNKSMVAVGKAAAIAHIAIDTARGAIGAVAAFAPIPIVGPTLGMAAAAMIIAYGAEQIGRVNSTAMAEGGIVQATSGGMLATIGEAGKDEAVIPLDDEEAKEKLGLGQGGSTYNITVMGGMLGDEQSAREFAVAVDMELMKLRRANQSVAFDSGLT